MPVAQRWQLSANLRTGKRNPLLRTTVRQQKTRIKNNVSKTKRLLSYLWEQSLEVTSSDYNPYLEVSLVHGRLQLIAEDAIYSFGDYYLNFRKVFEALNYAQLPDHAETLVLGLGLGSIPELLESHIGVDYDFVAVEIDPVIIELAAYYSLPRLESSVEVVQADAMAFLQVDRRKFDLICVDVFQDALIPEHLNGNDFLDLLKDSLNPNGAIIYNRLAATQADKAAARQFFETVFLPAFPDGHLFNTGGNYMLINDKAFLN